MSSPAKRHHSTIPAHSLPRVQRLHRQHLAADRFRLRRLTPPLPPQGVRSQNTRPLLNPGIYPAEVALQDRLVDEELVNRILGPIRPAMLRDDRLELLAL